MKKVALLLILVVLTGCKPEPKCLAGHYEDRALPIYNAALKMTTVVNRNVWVCDAYETATATAAATPEPVPTVTVTVQAAPQEPIDTGEVVLGLGMVFMVAVFVMLGLHIQTRRADAKYGKGKWYRR